MRFSEQVSISDPDSVSSTCRVHADPCSYPVPPSPAAPSFCLISNRTKLQAASLRPRISVSAPLLCVWAFGPVVCLWMNCFPDWFDFSQGQPEPLLTGTQTFWNLLQYPGCMRLSYHAPKVLNWSINICKQHIALKWLGLHYTWVHIVQLRPAVWHMCEVRDRTQINYSGMKKVRKRRFLHFFAKGRIV